MKLVPKNTNNSEIAFLPLFKQARLIRRKKISSEELTRIYINRIKSINYILKMNAFISVDFEGAIRRAKELDQLASKNIWLSEIHGTVLALKDDIQVVGMPMTVGSKLLKNFYPIENAAIINELYNAGVILIGKTNMDEFAYGIYGRNENFGNIKNPYDQLRISGGSSSGSAVAVAAGFSSAALGSDASGSIRIPAAACCVFGYKSSVGFISSNGITRFSPSKSSVGILARDAKDFLLIANVLSRTTIKKDKKIISEFNLSEKRNKKISINNMRFGVITEYIDICDFEVKTEFENFIKNIMKRNIKVKKFNFQEHEILNNSAQIISQVEHAKGLADFLRNKFADKSLIGLMPEVQKSTRNLFENSLKIKDGLYDQALNQNKNIILSKIGKIFEEVDVLLLPTLPTEPPIFKELFGSKSRQRPNPDKISQFKYLVEPASYLGLPVTTIPLLKSKKYPVSIQLIGKKLQDVELLEATIELQKKLNISSANLSKI